MCAVTNPLDCPILLPCNVREPGQLEEVVAAITQRWGSLDFGLHAIAFAPRDDLHVRATNRPAAAFAQAKDVSCHSFIRMADMAEPLMRDGGALPFYGAERVVAHYNLIGPVKAALESAAR